MFKRICNGLLFSLVLLIPSGVAGATKVPIFSDAVDNPPRFWREVMAHFYGPYDTKKRCWIGQSSLDGRAGNYCMRPHKLETLTVDNLRTSYLVTAGYQINSDGLRDSCHACPGFMGMAVLRSTMQSHIVLARNSMFESFGSWGQVPAEAQFFFHKLGPMDNYGWHVQSGWTGQGITQSWTSIFGKIDDQMRNIGTVPRAYDEEGNCKDGKHLQSGHPCSDYSYDIQIDTTDRQAKFHQLQLLLTGTQDGKTLNRSFRAKFDPTTNRYRLPDGIPSDR